MRSCRMCQGFRCRRCVRLGLGRALVAGCGGRLGRCRGVVGPLEPQSDYSSRYLCYTYRLNANRIQISQMAVRILDSSGLESQIRQALDRLDAGHAPRAIETTHVDFKEEPGRRTPTGGVIEGGVRNERAAEYLAREMACMANTPGGGAIILGVADDGTRIGTLLCPDSLRHQIYELTDRALTISVRVAELDAVRLLVLSTHEAIEPIRFRGRVHWRVDKHCVEIDPSSWHEQRMHRSGFDWSAQPSQYTMEDVNLVAVEIARDYLREGGTHRDTGLVAASHRGSDPTTQPHRRRRPAQQRWSASLRGDSRDWHGVPPSRGSRRR